MMVRNRVVDLGSIDQGITSVQFRRKLSLVVKDAGGPAKAAREWGVAAQHIGSAMSGTKLPTPGILKAMGYEPVKEILYRYKEVK